MITEDYVSFETAKLNVDEFDVCNKIDEMCSKYPIDKLGMKENVISVYQQGVFLGAWKMYKFLKQNCNL